MGSEIRRSSADDPGETASSAPVSDHHAVHWPYQELTRRELDDLPDYDGAVPAPLEGADPGNEDPGEPAETTGLGEGYHSAEEYRAWLAARNAREGHAVPAGESGGWQEREQPRPDTWSIAGAEQQTWRGEETAGTREASPDSGADDDADTRTDHGADSVTDRAADRTADSGADDERVEQLENELVESHASQRKLIDALSRRDDKVEKLESENERLKAELAEARKNQLADQPGGGAGETDAPSGELARIRDEGPQKDGTFDENRKRFRLPGVESVAVFSGAVNAADAIGAFTHMLSSADAALIGGVATLIGAGYLWGKKKWDNYQERRNADRQQD